MKLELCLGCCHGALFKSLLVFLIVVQFAKSSTADQFLAHGWPYRSQQAYAEPCRELHKRQDYYDPLLKEYIINHDDDPSAMSGMFLN